jgi:hypothetical protein
MMPKIDMANPDAMKAMAGQVLDQQTARADAVKAAQAAPGPGFTIDLMALGMLIGSAENAKDYMFYLIMDRPQYTKAALEANPSCVAATDLIFKSPMVPDNNGHATVDLRPHKDAIKAKLKDSKTMAKAAVLASSRDTNEEPQLKMAAFESCTIMGAILSLGMLEYGA